MKKIYKIIHIALIFMLIGVFLGEDFAYGLRVPLISAKGSVFGVKSEPQSNLKIPVIDPSLLGIREVKDWSGAGEELIVEKAISAIKAQLNKGVKKPWIHFDIIGGKSRIVKSDNPKQTIEIITPGLLSKIKSAAKKEGLEFIVDVHIMLEEVDEDFIRSRADAGADYITLHWEGYKDSAVLKERILFINSLGIKAGMAFNPDVDVAKMWDFILKEGLEQKIGLLLQMSVPPGEGAQPFNQEVLKNIRWLRHKFSGLIQIDGGIEPYSTAQMAVEAWVDILVAGTAFFGKGEQTQAEFEMALDSFNIAIKKGYESRQKKESELGKSATFTMTLPPASAETADRTFIGYLKQEFSDYLNKQKPINILDIGGNPSAGHALFGRRDRAVFTSALKDLLDNNNVKSEIYCISPSVEDSKHGNVTLMHGLYQHLLDKPLEKGKYHIITINAPDFIYSTAPGVSGLKEFLDALDYLLADDGVVIFRPDEHSSGFKQTVNQAIKTSYKNIFTTEYLRYGNMRDLPEGDWSLLAPLLIKRAGVIKNLNNMAASIAKPTDL